jgi:hypothetical protein
MSLLLLGGALMAACSVDMSGLGAAGADAGQAGAAGTIGSGGGGASGSGGASSADGGGGAGGQVGAGGGAGGATPGCGPATCGDGCCAIDGSCVKGRNDQSCGNAGNACSVCAACLRCSDAGACLPDPSAPWDVVCVSAAIKPTKPGNFDWDPVTPGVSAAPDPFCQFTIDGMWAARTTTAFNTTAPLWNQSITPPDVDLTTDYLVSNAGIWGVAVLDDDATQTVTEPICSVMPSLVDGDFSRGTVTFPASQSCTSLTIRLVCAE